MTKPDAEFDAFSGSYDDAVNQSIAFSGLKVDFFTRVKAEYLLDLIQAHFGRTKDVRVLDVGCGIGNYHKLLIDHVGPITGVDVSARSVEEAVRRNPAASYLAYDGETLPFEDASFDVAFTVCVMHHVPPAQWPRFVSEVRRVLKPGGMFAVFEHNPWNPLTRRIVSNCVFDQNAVLLKARETKALLRNAGFTQDVTRFIFNIPASGKTLRVLDQAIGILPTGAQYYVKATA